MTKPSPSLQYKEMNIPILQLQGGMEGKKMFKTYNMKNHLGKLKMATQSEKSNPYSKTCFQATFKIMQ